MKPIKDHAPDVLRRRAEKRMERRADCVRFARWLLRGETRVLCDPTLTDAPAGIHDMPRGHHNRRGRT